MFAADYADFHSGYYRDVLLNAKYLSNLRQTNISNSLFILFISLLLCEF